MKISQRTYIYVMFIILAVFYITISLIAPLGPNRYNLTPAKTHVLQLTVLLPVILIWLAAIFGAERLKAYTYAIKGHKDGVALGIISKGVIVLAAAIIINSMFGVLRPWALKDGWLSPYTIFSNIVSAILPFIAFGFMFIGSNKLRKLAKAQNKPRVAPVLIALFLLAVGVAYAAALIHYKYTQITPDPNKYSSFYMSKPLVLLILALPYWIGWGLALSAAYNIHLYRQYTKGVIYKSALAKFEFGIAAVVIFYIVIQMFTAFSTYLASAGLDSILLLLYLLLLLYALGFLVIAAGVNQLTKIEEV